MTKKALLIIDVQNDFLPGGALAVNNGNEIIPVINQLTKLPFDFITASQDWHPQGHCSFAETHHKKPGEIVEVDGLKQILWPTHCVQGTKGAEFSPQLETAKIQNIILKGTEKNIDSYSTFFDNARKKHTALDVLLKKHHITDVYCVGLATDYCVKFSALDSLSLGYKTYIILDACRGVNLKPGDVEKAVEDMRKAGAHIIQSSDIKF